jgi:ankyrin repeat protein
LGVAEGRKHIEVIESLLAGEEWTGRREASAEALMRACLIGHTAAVKALLDKGAEVNPNHTNGWPPLMEAAFGGHAGTIRALLERGADVNAKDRTGWTSLMEAASKGHQEAVIVLLAYGADAKARNVHGWTALKVTPRGDTEIIKLLKGAAGRQ